jgi:predicted transcriptional regulator
MSATCTFRIDENTKEELVLYAKAHKRSVSFYISEAIESYMQELREEMEDAEIARLRMREHGKFYEIDEVIERLKARKNV